MLEFEHEVNSDFELLSTLVERESYSQVFIIISHFSIKVHKSSVIIFWKGTSLHFINQKKSTQSIVMLKRITMKSYIYNLIYSKLIRILYYIILIRDGVLNIKSILFQV